MKAIIELDVPEWQIGQDVTVYFPDTMMTHGKCELKKEQEEAIPVSWLESYTRLKCMGYIHDIVLDLIKTWKSVK